MSSVVHSTIVLMGLALIYWPKPLSLRYNAWTTRMRERYPHINPPPTPEWRRRNTTIMTVMFRVMGLFFVVMSGLALVGIIGPH
jgi:hypothetical protein